MRKGFLSHICYINGTILRKHVVFTSPDKRLLAVKPFRCEIAHTTQCDGLLIVASKDFDEEFLSFTTLLKQELLQAPAIVTTDALRNNKILQSHCVEPGDECTLYTLSPIDLSTLVVSDASRIVMRKVIL